MASPIVARVCARWLTSVPVRLSSGEPMPLRLGLAELALATARTLQLSLAKRDIWLGDGQEKIHEAAFTAAPDLPKDVAAWALEMARRRPLRADLALVVDEDRRAKAQTSRTS